MSASVADGGGAALPAGAGILARVIDARPVVGALAVGLALAALAVDEGVAQVAARARAHGPIFARVVVPRGARGVRAAGVRLTKVPCARNGNYYLYSYIILHVKYIFK